MYKELITQCRNCIESLCGECRYNHLLEPGNTVKCMNALVSDAADAIEELNKKYLQAEADNINLTGWLAEETAKHKRKLEKQQFCKLNRCRYPKPYVPPKEEET